MVALAKISVKSIHPQEGSNKQKEPFFILFTTWDHKIGHNRPSLVVRSSAGVHLVPHVILHLMKYWLSIFKKMADRAVEAELDFDEKQAALFIAS